MSSGALGLHLTTLNAEDDQVKKNNQIMSTVNTEKK